MGIILCVSSTFKELKHNEKARRYKKKAVTDVGIGIMCCLMSTWSMLICQFFCIPVENQDINWTMSNYFIEYLKTEFLKNSFIFFAFQPENK